MLEIEFPEGFRAFSPEFQHVLGAMAGRFCILVITMLGLQEARARAPRNPTRMLGRMTAAFAFGQ